MELGIRGKKALINGGSAGLGRASAAALAQEGVDLFISARGETRLRATCDTIAAATGVTVTPIVADHSNAEGYKRILDACPDPDILIGTSSPPRLVTDYRTVTDEELRAAIELGLLSPFSFMQQIVEGMAERSWGRVVNIASSAVKHPLQLRILSGAPRAALVNYSVAIAKAVAGRNVTINTLLPALHLTEGTRAIFEPIAASRGLTFEEEIAKQTEALAIPARRFGDAEEFGSIVAFFCGQGASYVTGQCLVVDGGLTNAMF
jgi:3-oxoacyl-[acyl-carrier protein] reductase